MAGGSWKVAYADFMTAMMAFFLLMWLLNATTEEQKSGLASFFSEGATGMQNVVSPVNTGDQTEQIFVDKLSTRELNSQEVRDAHVAIMETLQEALPKDSPLTTAAGMTSSLNGVMMTLTSNALFSPGSVALAPEVLPIMAEIVGIMDKYKVYLVVQGHADKSEVAYLGFFPSVWELSAARANSAVEYLINQGVDSRRIRSISYGDTNPKVPSGLPGAAEQNSRIVFNFHRPEVMSTVGSF